MCSNKKLFLSRSPWMGFLLAIGLLLATGSLAWGNDPIFPPPGTDTLPSSAEVLVQIFGQTMNIHMVGDPNIKTMVMRGPSTGPPPNHIQTEMIQLSLTGMTPMGQARLHLNPMAPRSMGMTQALQMTPDLPALSFFDIFVEVDLQGRTLVAGQPIGPPPGNIQPIPVHVVDDTLRCIPPEEGARFCTPPTFAPVPLTDQATNQIVGQIIRVWHSVRPHICCCVNVDDDATSNGVVTVLLDCGAGLVPVASVSVTPGMTDDAVSGALISALVAAGCRVVTCDKAKAPPGGPPDQPTTFIIECCPSGAPIVDCRVVENVQCLQAEGHAIVPPPKNYCCIDFDNVGAGAPLDNELCPDNARDLPPCAITVRCDTVLRTYNVMTAETDHDTRNGVFALLPFVAGVMLPDTCGRTGIVIQGLDNNALVATAGCNRRRVGAVSDSCDSCIPTPPPPFCCDSTVVPNCLVMCPESDIPYTITLKDCNGNPIGGLPATRMWMDFSGCQCVCPCPEETSWPIVYPNGASNAAGQATWYVDAGMQCPCPAPCVVKLCVVFDTPTGPDTCCYVIDRVTSTDINCNHVVDHTDFTGDPRCNDYDWNGTVDQNDKKFWESHLGHNCVPCDQFREHILIGGCRVNELKVGDTCQVCIVIQNNLPDTCCLDSLVYQVAGFNVAGGVWSTFCKQIFGGPIPRPCIPPGVTDTFCCTYVIPSAGHGCVRVLKFSDCCNDTVQQNLDADDDPNNCGQVCDTFRIPIQIPAGAIWCVVPVESLPPGWTVTYIPPLTVSPPTCFPGPGPGLITVIICTNGTPVIGQQGCVTLVVLDAAGVVKGKATVCKKISCHLGDGNLDGILTAADVVLSLNRTFQGTLAPAPSPCFDMNRDGVLTAADVVLLLNDTFLGVAPPGCTP